MPLACFISGAIMEHKPANQTDEKLTAVLVIFDGDKGEAASYVLEAINMDRLFLCLHDLATVVRPVKGTMKIAPPQSYKRYHGKRARFDDGSDPPAARRSILVAGVVAVLALLAAVPWYFMSAAPQRMQAEKQEVKRPLVIKK